MAIIGHQIAPFGSLSRPSRRALHPRVHVGAAADLKPPYQDADTTTPKEFEGYKYETDSSLISGSRHSRKVSNLGLTFPSLS